MVSQEPAKLSTALSGVWVQVPVPPPLYMEVIRPDEETVLKTAGGDEPLGGSSPSASAILKER